MFEKLDGWYKKAIPTYGTNAFATFLVNVGQFVSYISPGAPVRVSISKNAFTAACDVENREVILPAWCFVPETWREISETFPDVPQKDFGRAAVSCVTGMLIHEALHLRESPKRPCDTLITHMPELSYESPSVVNNAISCLQLIEDLHNEHWGRQQPYGFFIEDVSDILFTEDAFLVRQERLAESTTFADFYNLLLCYKNPRYRDENIWDVVFGQEIVDILRKALDTHDAKERAGLAVQLLNALDVKHRERTQKTEQLDNTNQLDSGSRWGGNDKLDVAPDGECLSPQKLNRLAQNIKAAVQSFLEDTELNDLASLENAINEIAYPKGKPSLIPAIVSIDVCSNKYSPYTCDSSLVINPAPEYARFGSIISMLRSKSWTPGPPMDHGRRIVPTRLHRIVTDSKIFGLPEERTTRDECEVILCCDASGSMGTLYYRVLSAAYGALLSLQQAGIDTQVFAHTTTAQNSPLLLKIAANTSSALASRFKLAAQVRNRETFDGEILRYLGKQFSGRANKKILIMLCDGEPSCGHYTGAFAIRDTKQAVESLRKLGIVVLVLSLHENVMENNNTIYGKTFNIDAVSNVEATLKKTLERLIL